MEKKQKFERSRNSPRRRIGNPPWRGGTEIRQGKEQKCHMREGNMVSVSCIFDE
jgi:hypothetical protein